VARKEIYHVQFKGHSDGFEVHKGDLDFNPTGIYHVDHLAKGCDCFASNKSTCRHREMVKLWQHHGPAAEIDGQKFTFRQMMEKNYWWEHDRNRWVKGVE
jgi:hypothetical protein